jgi:uncharacterized tellurite resistance protein B-like protein
MRSYPVNSPQAAARVLSMLMLADGHLSRPELDRLASLGAPERLGLSRDEMFQVLNSYCEERLQATHMNWAEACRLDLPTLRQLLSEIVDPDLRRTLLDLCVAVVGVDADAADDELRVLDEAAAAWNLPTVPMWLARRVALAA